MKKSGLPAIFPWAVGVVGILVILAVYNSWDIKWLSSFIIVPLCAYFFHVKSLKTYSQDIADSIYYFGFAITIITLAASALIHFGDAKGIENNTNLGLVFSQFGIGLIATCLGLLLRLWVVAQLNIQNHISTVEEEEQVRRQLISDLSILRLEVVGFAEQLKELNQNLHQQQKELHQKTVNELNELSKKSIENAQEASLNAIKNIGQATTSLQQQQQTFFTESLAVLKHTITEVNHSLKELNQKTYEQITSLDFTKASHKTNQAISKLGSSIDDFSSQTALATTHLSNTSTELGKFSTTIVAYQTQMGSFSTGLQSLTQSISSHATSTERHLKSSEDLLAKMNTQHQQSIYTYQQHQQASENAIQKTTKAVDAVASALTEVANQAVRKLN